MKVKTFLHLTLLLYITTYVILIRKKTGTVNSVGKMFVHLDLMFFVVIVSSNECFGNGHSNNEINRSEIELLKADNAKLWKELEKMTEKVQTLTENGHGTHGKCFDKTGKL